MRVEYIDHMGDDLRVVNAARVSFRKESDYELRGYKLGLDGEDTRHHPLDTLKDQDVKLINYLAKHNHWTPFSHPVITLREYVPIFVARQRFKHMVGFTYNEVSRRYVDDEPEFYVPDVWRSRPDGSVKQGSGEKEITEVVYQDKPESWLKARVDDEYAKFLNQVSRFYDGLIKSGVAPEQARMVLPQAMYTEYYVTGSLAAWARAYKLRIDGHAQKEIQELAEEWGKIIAPLFPVSWKALAQ